MLELIFQGFIEWLYGLVLECWNWFSTSLLDIMSLDLAYIRSHVPVITDIMQVLLAAGWALLLGNLVFQALKGMAAGLGFEAEDPKMLFGRSAVFSFLLLASPQICEIALDMTSRIITLLQIPNAINVHLVDASILGNLLAGWLVVIICNIIIMCEVMVLLLKIAEQYVVLSTLTITAPLAFSMGGSKSTAPIFNGWCRMYGSMCLLMVTNIMFFKMLLSVMSAIPSGLDVFPWMVLIFSIVKVEKRMDDTITRIGLNPAMTGGGGGRSLPGMVASTVIRGTVSQVTKTLGGAIGGAVTAAGQGAVGAGTAVAGAAAGAASAGLGSVFRPGRGQNISQQSNSQQMHNQLGSTQQPSAQQNQQNVANAPQPAQQQNVSFAGGTAYTDGLNSAASTGSSTNQNSKSSTTRLSRNSSVPSDTHRAPSYVRSTVNSQPGTAGTGPRSTGTAVHNGGDLGGGSRGGSNGPAGGSFRSSAASAIERNKNIMAGNSTTVDKMAPNTDAHTSRLGGSFGSRSARHPGTAGTTLADAGASCPGAAGTGGKPARRSDGKKPVSETPPMSRPGTTGAGMGGTALSHSGMAGTSAPANSAKGQTAQPGAASRSTPTRSTKVTGREHAGRTPVSSGGAATPPAKPAAPQHAQGMGSRSTRRNDTVARQSITRDPVERTTHRSGTAGTATPGAVRQPTSMPQAGRAVPPVTGPQPPKQAHSSPAQQETRQTSVSAKAPVGGTSPIVRPGTAGTAPEIRRETPERTTARKVSEGKKSGATQPQAPGIKRQTTPPAATGKKPGPKAPDRSGGGGHR